MKKFLLFLFFLSGFSALLYEIIWNHYLGLLLGSAIWSVSCVVFSFMIGLALGSYIFGKIADRSNNLIYLYAFLELGIGIYALIFPFIFKSTSNLILIVYPLMEKNIFLNVFLKFFIGFLIVIIPTILMGGTFPVFTSYITRTQKEIGFKVSLSYGLNTLGGALGSFFTGFFLIPLRGINFVLLIGVLLNFFIFISVLIFYKKTHYYKKKNEEIPFYKMQGLPSNILLFLFFITGFSALSLEILWTRLLLLIFGSSTYSFSAMLFVYLTGIAIGSLLFKIAEHLIKRLVPFLFSLFLFMGFIILIQIILIDKLPFYFLKSLAILGLSWKNLIITKILLSLILMLLPCLIFGILFPLLNRFGVHFAQKGKDLGLFYGVNTIGAGVGVLFVPFIFLPLLGLKNSLFILGIIYGIIGILYSLLSRKKLLFALGTAPLLLFVFLSLKSWNLYALSSGVYYKPLNFLQGQKINFYEIIRTREINFYKEGPLANVAVIETPSEKFLSIDGKIEVSTQVNDLRLVKLMGHLPMILHPNPEKVAVIGLGAGFTVGSILLYNPEKIDVIEISETVKKVVRYFLPGNPLNMKNVNLIIEDGFTFFSHTNNKYDIITSDPIEPVVRGAGNLYSYEHFLNAREHLKEKGIMAQFLPLYEMSVENIKVILKTFSSVFSYVQIWFTGSDCILLGSKSPILLQESRFDEVLQKPSVLEDLNNIGYETPFHLYLSYIGNFNRKIENLPINTISNLYLEFSAPKSFPRLTISENLQYVLYTLSEKTNLFFKINETLNEKKRLFFEGILSYYTGNLDSAISNLERAFILEKDIYLRELLSELYLVQGFKHHKEENIKQAYRSFFKSLYYDNKNVQTMEAISEILLHIGQYKASLAYAEKAISLWEKSPYAYVWASVSARKLGMNIKATIYAKRASELLPGLKVSKVFELHP